jgi:hypothetical protein
MGQRAVLMQQLRFRKLGQVVVVAEAAVQMQTDLLDPLEVLDLVLSVVEAVEAAVEVLNSMSLVGLVGMAERGQATAVEPAAVEAAAVVHLLEAMVPTVPQKHLRLPAQEEMAAQAAARQAVEVAAVLVRPQVAAHQVMKTGVLEPLALVD